MKHLRKIIGGTALLASAALIPSLAFATAANTTITNTVTVSFSDAANNPQTPVEANVSISVNLVASAPLLTSPADIDPTTEDTGVNLVYTITSTANGPDTYNFSSADTRANMDADATFSAPTVLLGATTVASGITAADTVITVPFDGTDDGVVNGLAVGDIIVIDPTGTAEVAEIDSIDESTGAASNTVTITLTAGTTNAFTYGTTIGERDDVTVVVTTDTITSGTSGTHSVLSTATSDADGAVFTTQTTATVVTVRRPVLTVTKYVRNVTTVAFNPLVADITVDGVDYYASGVSGNPTDTMQYLIVIDNSAAGAGTANNIVVSDPIPQFTTFVPGSIRLDDNGDPTVAFIAQNEAADGGDAAELDTTGNGTVYVYAGAGGDDTAAGAGNGDGGTLTAGQISHVIFQVTID